MKKIKLNLSELKVESFNISSRNSLKGTVKGQNDTEFTQYNYDCPEDTEENYSCDASCNASCNNTCNYSCNGTCNYTCNGTCNNTCVQTCKPYECNLSNEPRYCDIDITV